MDFAWIVNGGVALSLVWAAVQMVRQRRRKARNRTGELVISPLAGLSVGTMLLGFQEIVNPQVRNMIVEEMKEQSLDGAEEPLGGRVLHEQLRRIRSGEEVEALTVRMKARSEQ